MKIDIKQIMVPPGHQVLLKDISWQMFEHILEELGEHRNTRISYSQGLLEIMTPLLEHESGKEMIGDLIKALFEELEIEFLSAGSTTFKNEKMAEGVEPDSCFYIQNEAVVRGLNRINLETDPPPDLVIEIDITSRTRLHHYEALGVPELWQWNGSQLQINILRQGKYAESETSPIFPNLAIKEVIPNYLQQSKTIGRNAAMKGFRAWVRQQISSV